MEALQRVDSSWKVSGDWLVVNELMGTRKVQAVNGYVTERASGQRASSQRESILLE